MTYFQKTAVILSLAVVGCSHAEKEKPKAVTNNAFVSVNSPTGQRAAPRPDEVSIEAKLAGAQANTPYVAEVQFKKGSWYLNEEQKKKLNLMVEKAKDLRTRERADVLVWGDKERQTNHAKTEPLESEIQVATRRAEEIQKYLDEAWGTKVSVENMAKRPGKIDAFFKTETYRMRQAFEELSQSSKLAGKAVVILVAH